MKSFRSILSFTMAFVIIVISLTGCNSSKKSPDCPFTKLTWDNSYDDMIALEGKCTETDDSIYNGTTYIYPRKYLGLDGTINYMYDDKNKLVCVAWSYTAKSTDDLKSVYSKIHDTLKKTCGDSGYSTSNSTNYGDVWYREEGNIILSAVTTSSITALQYSYLSPAVSSKDE